MSSLKIKSISMLEILIFLVFLTSSFDIFMSIDIFGFTFRISQILCIVLYTCYVVKIFKDKRILMPIGYEYLLIWVIFILCFTFNTALPKINYGYDLWLIFNIILIFSLTRFLNTDIKFERVFKLYIISFACMGVIGIVQFILGILGINMFITQWWRPGFPRINGFCFEPSYYATYMIMGWIISRILVRNKETCKTLDINMHVILFINTIALLLSSSRIGIALAVIFEGILFIVDLFNKKIMKTLCEIIFGLIVIIAILVTNRYYNLSFLLAGTGINGNVSHSVSIRENDLENVLDVFKESPILGRGLGGVYAQIVKNKGMDVYSVNVQDEGAGICVFAEVLAASGIVGFIFFVLYLWKLLSNSVRVIKNEKNEYKKQMLISLLFSFIMEFVILQFNQNILRIYVWINIAMLTVAIGLYKKESEKK